MKNKKTLSAAAALCILAACSSGQALSSPAPEETPLPAETARPAEYETVEAGIAEIKKYGNIVLTVSPDTMRGLGYEPADIILVRIGDAEMEMPVGTSYSDADSGEPVCCYKMSTTSGKEETVLAINSGDLTTAMGFAERHKADNDAGYEWVYQEGYDASTPVIITMKEKQGYAAEYAMHQLGSTRTNDRGDYPDLSDDEFANFRAVSTSGMGTGTLFRSTSPIDPALNRNKEADAALVNAMIRTVMNMANSENTMKQFEGYSMTGYAKCDIIALDMGMDYFSEDTRKKLADGFRYFASHEGPYLIHCKEGKDRTGFAIAILECLMGAGADEVDADYMLTYYNFYGIRPGSAQYGEIAAGNIDNTLARAFGISSIHDENTDLRACAEDYLKDIGLTPDEISALKEKLARNYGGLS